jgi:hydroxypyruvate reductase
MLHQPPERFLRRLFDAAVAAAAPERVVGFLPPPPRGRTIVVGAGKGAAAMARAVEEAWPGPLSGLVVTRYGHGVPTRRVEVIEAGHPLPDAEGGLAARRILALAEAAGADDLVLALITGGASALLTLPAPEVGFGEMRAITRELLRCGAAIGEINTVRKHLSAIGGGRLAAAAAPATVVALVISDVPGDDPAVIGSGPTVADPTTGADAAAILRRYRIGVSEAVSRRLRDPAAETPKPGDPRLGASSAVLIATPGRCLEAAAHTAARSGAAPTVLGDAIEGLAEDVAFAHARLALEAAARPLPVPRLLLSGGETSVNVIGRGRGGRNTQYLLALAVALGGRAGIHAIACDTDGIDGSEDNAGAILGPDTLARAAAAGLDARAHLAGNDAYTFFARLGDLVVTGPTRTNVNDFRAILIN